MSYSLSLVAFEFCDLQHFSLSCQSVSEIRLTFFVFEHLYSSLDLTADFGTRGAENTVNHTLINLAAPKFLFDTLFYVLLLPKSHPLGYIIIALGGHRLGYMLG